jgi:hypothetical protein
MKYGTVITVLLELKKGLKFFLELGGWVKEKKPDAAS